MAELFFFFSGQKHIWRCEDVNEDYLTRVHAMYIDTPNYKKTLDQQPPVIQDTEGTLV